MRASTIRDVIVVGSGPSGYTAALYAARAHLRPLVFEGAVSPGGALMTTTAVENYPGSPDGIIGPDLMDRMRCQAQEFGSELISEDVTSLSLSGPVKVAEDSAGNVHCGRSVILAMGSKYRKLGLSGEDRFAGRGVSWCATCDGYFFREQDIAVVGGGDTAVEEAMFLTRFASKVTLIHRRETLSASHIMQERLFRNPKIEIAWNTAIDQFHGNNDGLTGLRLIDVRSGERRELGVTGLFVAIGHEPRSDLVRDQVELDRAGYVLVQATSTETSVPGVFACGDLVDRKYRQAITAAGSGCAAALDAERYLTGLADDGI